MLQILNYKRQIQTHLQIQKVAISGTQSDANNKSWHHKHKHKRWQQVEHKVLQIPKAGYLQPFHHSGTWREFTIIFLRDCQLSMFTS